MKIAVIGGGSTYTPELVSGSRAARAARRRELVLHDIDARAARGRRRARAADARPAGLRAAASSSPSDLDRAVDGADFVLSRSASAGRRRGSRDETVPLACGCIGQETTGAGGLAKALRTVPVVLDIAERVRERAADGAWIVDFTNPVGIVTRALLDAGHRAVGLCNVAIGFQRQFARLLGVEPERVVVDQVGLNHLTWVRRVLARRRGRAARAARRARRRARRAASSCRARLHRRARRDPVVLPALLLRARRGARRAARRACRARRRSSRRSSASCSSCTATRPRREAGAARAARRRVLQRGRHRPRRRRSPRTTATSHVVDVRNDGTLAGPGGRRRGRGAAHASTRAGATPLPQRAARAGAARA